MSNPSPLTLTITLSLATLLGYGAYRLLYAPVADPAAGLADHPYHADEMSGVAALPDTLPDLTLANLDGGATAITSWPGRPLIVNFWATWCAPCLREIPLLRQFQQDHPEVQIVGIAVDREEPVRQFVAEMEIGYPILIGQAEAMDVATAFGAEVFVMPYTVFTTSTGETLGHHAGELHREHLTDLAATLAALDTGGLDLEAARARLSGLR